MLLFQTTKHSFSWCRLFSITPSIEKQVKVTVRTLISNIRLFTLFLLELLPWQVNSSVVKQSEILKRAVAGGTIGKVLKTPVKFAFSRASLWTFFVDFLFIIYHSPVGFTFFSCFFLCRYQTLFQGVLIQTGCTNDFWKKMMFSNSNGLMKCFLCCQNQHHHRLVIYNKAGWCKTV